MRYAYVVILKRESVRKIHLISIFLCVFSALSFLYEQSRTLEVNYLLLSVSLLLLVGTGLNIYYERVRNLKPRYQFLLLLAGIGWLAVPQMGLIIIVFVLLSLLEAQTKYPLEIGFSPDEIVINTLIKRRVHWSDLSNVVLKDGLLTLDYKNNRLFQKEVEDDGEDDADEDEFNAFCRERLNFS